MTFNAIARATSGASGAELANIINEAALRAVRMGRAAVSQSDLEESVETVIAGYQRKGAVISEKEKRDRSPTTRSATPWWRPSRTTPPPCTRSPSSPAPPARWAIPCRWRRMKRCCMTREEALNKIATLTGGRAAEELIFGTVTSGASNDIEQATRLARAMVTRYGMSEHFDMMALETVSNQYLGGDASLACSTETAARIDGEVI